MGKRYSSQIDLFQMFSPILIILYLCIGFIPNLEAVDKIAPQWLAMTGLNLVSVLVIFYYKKTISKTITASLVATISITYIGFIFWAAFSYFYAINPTEVIVNITRQVNVLIMMLCMGILLFKMKQKPVFISWVITLILSIEVYSVLNEALNMINNTGVISPGDLKGVTANRNITAFSLAIKIPFTLYLILRIKKVSFKLLLGGLIFLSIFCLTMIQSRASFIAIGLILINYTALNIYLYLREERKISKLLQIGYFILPLLFALIINQTVIADKGADAISRAATISLSTNDGSVNQRLRYYQDVLLHMKSNLIFGAGLGNWKLKSIEYDSKEIQGYIVPYHAHSDFIQLGAELGIIGFLLYLGIFLWAVYYVYILIRYSDILIEEKVFLFFYC
jgi:O-antigen ligase